jgi:hypothetical protein
MINDDIMTYLHIVNGDSTRLGLEPSGVPGTFISWSDVLHEGPTPAGLSTEEWRRVRANHLASLNWGPPDPSFQYGVADDAMEAWPEYHEVVFWLEHDLYDQLILIRHLDWLSRIPDRGRTRFSLVCGDRYLGLLQPAEFPPLFESRTPIREQQVQLGVQAWSAFRAPDPRGLETFASTPSPELPFLAGALRRHLEDFPSTANGLARSEAQIVRALSDGPLSLDQLFGKTTRMEERIYMGDSTFWSIVRRLATARHPLLDLEVQPRPDRLPAGTASLTTTGRDVGESRADHITLNGIDRWMGGCHLTPKRYFRWNGNALRA